jgi:hypothetical protein
VTQVFLTFELRLIETQAGVLWTAALGGDRDDLDRLIEQLRLWHGGGLRTEAGHFAGWSLGARFYPVLYMLTRMGEAKDWGLGIPLKSGMLGKMSKLEVHHISPKHSYTSATTNGPR